MTTAIAGRMRRTPQAVFALLAGALFGAGLGVSGMANPAKVLGFLDIAGAWDPTLAFVMAGALLVTAPAFRWVLKRRAPWFGSRFALPTKTDLEPRLVVGAALFGIGWGIAGLCPGPAVTDLITGRPGIVLFVASMIAGTLLYDLLVAGEARKSTAR
jgi:uncharacterized protein